MILAVDTETTGSDFWHGCRAFILTACNGVSTFIWSGTVDPFDRSKVTWSPKDLREIQNLLNSASVLVFHNAKFDMRAMEYMGLEIEHLWPKVHDTILAHHCLASGDKHGLKYLAFKYLDWYNDDEKDLARAVQSARGAAKDKGYDIAVEGHKCFPGLTGQKVSWWKLDYWLCIEEASKYAMTDPEMTWLLHREFQEALKDNGVLQQYNTRRKLLLIAYEMERAGYNMYYDDTVKVIDQLKLKAEHLRRKIQDQVGYKYEWDPSNQEDLHNFFHIRLGLPVLHKTETGRASLNKGAIEDYITKNPDKTPLKLYDTFKKTSTQVSHLSAYLNWINPTTKRIHSSVWITGTRETRQSYSDPNTQNINKKLRHVFGPPPGKSWLELDMVNIEMRIWAYMVGNQELIHVFETTGSVHLLVAELLYPELFKELGPNEFKKQRANDEYSWVKNGNFAIIYGATEYKADTTYKQFGAYKKIARRFPEVPRFTRACIEEAERNYRWYLSPHVTTLGGYNLDVPLTDMFKAVNYKVQGSAGWMMTESMIEVDKNPDYLNAGCQMIQQVHDSLTIEVETRKLTQPLIDSIVQSMEAPGLKYMPTSKVSYEIKNGPN
jgi:DNA polymerase I-like protein with 3'-5' exonuclease and polymerase domains